MAKRKKERPDRALFGRMPCDGSEFQGLFCQVVVFDRVSPILVLYRLYREEALPPFIKVFLVVILKFSVPVVCEAGAVYLDRKIERASENLIDFSNIPDRLVNYLRFRKTDLFI